MRFEAFVALRYLRGKRKNRFVSLITIISVAGVSVGVIALIVVMSVMTGFDNELRETIIGNRSHLTLTALGGRAIRDYQGLIEDLEDSFPEVVAAAPVIEVQGLIQAAGPEGGMSGAYIIGVDPERQTRVTQLADNLTKKDGRTRGRGELPHEKKEIILGFRLAQQVGVSVGDRVLVTTARQRAHGFSARPTKVALTVSGVSQAQMSDIDQVYAFTNLETARMLLGRDADAVDAIQCKLTGPFLTDAVATRALAERVRETFGLRGMTWYESQREFFEALVQEKVVMFIILVFIIMVAAFNITSSLIMIVMEKRRDIGILRTLGLSTGSTMFLFVLEGLYIGVGGTLAGLVGGVLLAMYLNPIAEFIAGLLGVDLFNSQIYYFDQIPVAILPGDVAWITICAVVLTFLSTLYPAWSASRLNPVDALRYE